MGKKMKSEQVIKAEIRKEIQQNRVTTGKSLIIGIGLLLIGMALLGYTSRIENEGFKTESCTDESGTRIEHCSTTQDTYREPICPHVEPLITIIIILALLISSSGGILIGYGLSNYYEGLY